MQYHLGVHGLSTGLQELRACTHLPPSLSRHLRYFDLDSFLIDMCKWQSLHNTLATCVSRVSSWLFRQSIDGQLSSDYVHNVPRLSWFSRSTCMTLTPESHDFWLHLLVYLGSQLAQKIIFSCANWLEWIQLEVTYLDMLGPRGIRITEMFG